MAHRCMPLLVLLAFWLSGRVRCDEAASVTLDHDQWTSHFGTILLGSNGQAVGSGFAYGSHKDIVTCAHVVSGAYFIHHETNLFFSAQDSVRRKLTLKYILPRFDLAVFSPTPEIKGQPIKLGDAKKARPGDKIIYIGYDQRRSSTTNVVSEINTATVTATGSAMNEGGIVDFLEFNGVGIPGYSGGPVFNANGELVAVMREAWTKKGVKGGPEILINRAFTTEILGVLDGQVFSRILPEPMSTNKSGISLLDVLDVPKDATGQNQQR
jgi:S1-C subfamily serine protease